MERRVEALRRSGTRAEFYKFKGVGHGVGPGKGTSAEGWIVEAIRFWDTSIRGQSSLGCVGANVGSARNASEATILLACAATSG